MPRNCLIDQFGNSLSGVTVGLYAVGTTANPLYTLETDTEGKYDISSVVEGNYDIKFSGGTLASDSWDLNRFISKGTHETSTNNPHSTTLSQVATNGGVISGTVFIPSIIESGAIHANSVTITGDLIVSGTTHYESESIIVSNLRVDGNSQLGNQLTDHTVISGSILVSGDITTTGNIIGKITDVSFGDISTNSIANTTEISTATIETSGNVVISGTLFGDASGLGNIPAAAVNHNSLSSLQGGQASEYYHLTSSDYSARVTTSNSVALTNKTIDADSNTISNIDNNEIKSNAGIAWSKVSKTGSNLTDIDIRSHLSLSSVGQTSHPDIDYHIGQADAHLVSGSIVGTENNQTLTNKIIPAISGSAVVVVGNLNVHGNINGNISDLNFESLTVQNDLTVGGNIAVTGNVDGRNISTDGTNLDSHIAASSGIHGVTGSVVGSTDVQTLTSKTITSPIVSGTLLGEKITSTNLIVGGNELITGNIVISGTLFGGNIATEHNNLTGLQGGGLGQYYHFTSSDYTDRVTTSNSVTLTNKIVGDSLIISGTVFGEGATFGGRVYVSNQTPSTDNELTSKAYVDAQISGENFWDRNGTQVTPHTSGDSVAISGTTFTQQLESIGVNVGGNANFRKIIVSGSVFVNGTVDGRDVSLDGTNQDAHIAASSLVHGVIGSVVGTSDTQGLTNKTIDADLNTISNIDNNEIKVAAAIDWTKISKSGSNLSDLPTRSHLVLSNAGTATHEGIDTHLGQTNAHFVSGTIVGTDNQQTLNNKTIPAISGTIVITGDLNVFGNINGNIGDIDFTNINTQSITNSGNIQTTTETVTGNLIVSGTLFGKQVEATGINVGGDLNVTGNISGNITDVTFGDISTNSVANTNSISTATFSSIGNVVVSGTLFGQVLTGVGLSVGGNSRITGISTLDTVDINAGMIDGATIATSDITVGASKTLNVSAGTLTLADNQISGDKVEGGTINATTINALTSSKVIVSGSVFVDGTVDGRDLSADGINLDAHIAASSGVHGAVGTIVGTSDAQTLTNKTITSPVVSGTLLGEVVTATSLTVGGNERVSGNLTVDGNISGNITDVTFGDISTNSVSNTASISTATLSSSGAVVVSGTLFGQQVECVSLNVGTTGVFGVASGQFIRADHLTEKTFGHSIVIDNNWDAAGRTCVDLGAITTADINGGTIDNSVIGGATPATGAFTTLISKDNTTLNDATTETTVVSGTMFAQAGSFGGDVSVSGAATIGGNLALAADVYTTAWTDYSASSTIVGWSSFITKLVQYKKIGRLVFIAVFLDGTSNANSVTFTVPFATVASPALAYNFFGRPIDNGDFTLTSPALCVLGANSSTVTCYKDTGAAVWTASGQKRIAVEFWYEAAN